MNIRNDPVFLNSLREVVTQGGRDVRLGLLNGRVYDKDSTKFKIYAGLAKFFHVRSEKSARHIDLLDKLVRAKSQIDDPTAMTVTNTAINTLIHKMTQYQEIRTIAQHPEDLGRLCNTIQYLSRYTTVSVADRLVWLNQLRGTHLSLVNQQPTQQISTMINETMARLVSDLIDPYGITNMSTDELHNVLSGGTTASRPSTEEIDAIREKLREINPQNILDPGKRAVIQAARDQYWPRSSS